MTGSEEFAWLRDEDKMPADLLRQHADHVRALLDHPGWQFIIEVLGYSQQRAVNRMTTGGPHEQAQYAEWAGFIRALRAAYEAPQQIVRIADSEREKRQRDAELAEREREQR